jgi:glycosidase
MEFHISRNARDKYQFDQSLFALDGNVLFADLYAVRQFVNKVNQRRDLLHHPELTLKTGQVNALGLIDEIFHHVLFLYRRQVDPNALTGALESLRSTLGQKETDDLLALFLAEFPPLAVYNSKQSAKKYLNEDTKGIPNRLLVLEELILLYVTIHNPALDQCAEFFEAPTLEQSPVFQQTDVFLQEYFARQPGFGPQGMPLIELLMSPARHVPHSLTGQLEYIREHWSSFLGEYFYRILASLDLIKEEEKWAFAGVGGAGMPTPVFDAATLRAMRGAAGDKVAFSPDRDWMPGLVLIAKNTYVWLDQLSKKYQRSITRLDQIPGEELAALSQSGITGLWLIGLWERSRASAEIKRLCGNPEAIASAYSLASYSIASDLGGEEAYVGLREQAWQHGIRLASDMVPNHMGIDSDWVLHHPDWFLGLDQCPYPSYSFNGQDLSRDPAVILQIEDHYFDKTDAAVVFRRIDRSSGRTRYIYHGNDGTSMPWNDTAQLDYLKAEVREQVYQTILGVARKFPIIRFDAAMTLARKQVQRLWFPEPGQGGAIPSRSEHALTQAQFDAAMPEEFWRGVVDRIAQDAPDTLLLAEAFWMMEGYFVRTLGMHRVYNSAFMHMLRDENNAGYRQLLKNTLEFEPEILKRYVNFMNNPDEKTAVEQFGKDDKYFGVCTLMVTFPGLPMFGHGQIEGFAEKYGMEYRRAYLEEIPDSALAERHRREIFPLLHKRRQFSGVDDFWLFDFIDAQGQVNENVYAFSNALGGDHNLVIFNNSYSSTSGRIRTSSSRLKGGNKSKRLVNIELAASLGLGRDAGKFVLFSDQSSGLEFIRPLRLLREEGLRMDLNGYEHHVFYGFRTVTSGKDHDYARLWDYLGERGVPDIEVALTELLHQPVMRPFREIVNPGYFGYLGSLGLPPSAAVMQEAGSKFNALLEGIEKSSGALPNKETVAVDFTGLLKSVLALTGAKVSLHPGSSSKTRQALKYIQMGMTHSRLYTLITWAFIGNIGRLTAADPDGSLSISKAEEWQFYKTFAEVFHEIGIEEEEISRSLQALKLITAQQDWYGLDSRNPTPQILERWFSLPEIQSFLKVNRFENTLWYNRESFADLLWWMTVIAVVRQQGTAGATENQTIETLLGCLEIVRSLQKANTVSDFQVDRLLSWMNSADSKR